MINISVQILSIPLVLLMTGITLMGWGYLTIQLLCPYKYPHFKALSIGIGFAMIIAVIEALHLIMSIDWKMSLFIMIIGMIGFFLSPISGVGLLKKQMIYCRNHPIFCTFILLTFMLMVLKDMQFPAHPDAGLYHFPTIKWLNEYPLVTGLANLHDRFGFNQSYFEFPAILNFYPFWNKGYAISGIFLILLSLYTLIELKLYQLKHGLFISIALIATIASQIKWMSSPSPDFAVAILEIIIFMLLLRISTLNKGNENINILYLSCVLMCITLFSTKLSGSMFALCGLTVATLLYLLKRPHIENGLLIKLALCVASIGLVHLYSGYILSGAPLYPSTFAMNESAEWSLSKHDLQHMTDVIIGWGRLPGSHGLDTLGNWAWFDSWSNRLSSFFQLKLAISFYLIGLSIYFFANKYHRKPLDTSYLIYFPFAFSLPFWFFTSPDIRFLGALLDLTLILLGWHFLNNRANIKGDDFFAIPIFIALIIWLIFDQNLSVIYSISVLIVILIVLYFFKIRESNKNIQWQYFTLIPISCFLMILSLLPQPKIGIIRDIYVVTHGWYKLPQATTSTKKMPSGLMVYVAKHGLCWNKLPCTPYGDILIKTRDGNNFNFHSGFIQEALKH